MENLRVRQEKRIAREVELIDIVNPTKE